MKKKFFLAAVVLAAIALLFAGCPGGEDGSYTGDDIRVTQLKSLIRNEEVDYNAYGFGTFSPEDLNPDYVYPVDLFVNAKHIIFETVNAGNWDGAYNQYGFGDMVGEFVGTETLAFKTSTNGHISFPHEPSDVVYLVFDLVKGYGERTSEGTYSFGFYSSPVLGADHKAYITNDTIEKPERAQDLIESETNDDIWPSTRPVAGAQAFGFICTGLPLEVIK